MLAAMFNVGGGEVLVIALIALIVLGPNRLPGAARQAGKVLGDLRRISAGFQNEVRTAFEEADRADRAEAAEAPEVISASIARSAGSGSRRFCASMLIAPRKQADQPAASSCSGFVPSLAVPGAASRMSRRPSSLLAAPSRPPVM